MSVPDIEFSKNRANFRFKIILYHISVKILAYIRHENQELSEFSLTAIVIHKNIMQILYSRFCFIHISVKILAYIRHKNQKLFEISVTAM